MQEGVGSAATRQRKRNDDLEKRVEALEKGHGELERGQDSMGRELGRRVTAVERRVESLRREDALGTGAGHAGAGPVRSEGGAPVVERKPRVRREYPDLATLEPAEDDEEVFAEAWPLIVEWRELRDSYSSDGRGLGWLRARERLMEVELALLEEHGMTLPPEKQPLRGLDRSGQVSWRRTALHDTRRALRTREFLVAALRRLTFNRWPRQPVGG